MSDFSCEEKYCRKLLSKSSNVAFDAACYISNFSRTYLNELDGELSANKKCFCPKCATPWIAGFFKSRLIPAPRSSKLKLLLRRKKAGRLSSLDKKLLLAAEDNNNLQVITCISCKYKFVNCLDRPVKKKPEPIPDEVPVIKKSKKKRKRKDKSAGLNLENICINQPQSKIKLAKMDLATSDDESESKMHKERSINGKSTNVNKSLTFVPFASCKQTPLIAKIVEKKKKKNSSKLNRLQKALNNTKPDTRPQNLASFLDSFR